MCRDMERAMANKRYLLYHGGIFRRDWFSDKLSRSDDAWEQRWRCSVEPIQCIQHFNRDQNGKGHGHWMWIVEHVAIDIFPFFSTSSAFEVMFLKRNNMISSITLRRTAKNRMVYFDSMNQMIGSQSNRNGLDVTPCSCQRYGRSDQRNSQIKKQSTANPNKQNFEKDRRMLRVGSKREDRNEGKR